MTEFHCMTTWVKKLFIRLYAAQILKTEKNIYSQIVLKGSLELDLLNLVPPAKTPEKCTLEMFPGMMGTVAPKAKPKSLFSRKSVRGWWPCANVMNGSRTLTVGLLKSSTLFYISLKH